MCFFPSLINAGQDNSVFELEFFTQADQLSLIRLVYLSSPAKSSAWNLWLAVVVFAWRFKRRM